MPLQCEDHRPASGLGCRRGRENGLVSLREIMKHKGRCTCEQTVKGSPDSGEGAVKEQGQVPLREDMAVFWTLSLFRGVESERGGSSSFLFRLGS